MNCKACFFLRSQKYGVEYLFGRTYGYSLELAETVMSQRKDGQVYEILDADARVLRKYVSAPNPRETWRLGGQSEI